MSKKLKLMTLQDRVEQFKEDMYEDGQILTPQRHSLSDNNFKEMAALYFNGDIKAQNICE